MSKDDARLERLQGMLRQRGILLPAFDMYGGAKGLYDFGPGGGRLAAELVIGGSTCVDPSPFAPARFGL